ncbi:MAG: hypothetical protein FWG90_02350 [Oscillospiraceae bacterium]|nr:hypothetical protein [Oscillospiraceae bacterium]
MNRKSTTQDGEKTESAKVNIFQTIFTLPKQRSSAFITSSAMFIISLFLLMPLDLYLHNVNDFNIGVADFIFPMLIISLCLFAFVLIIFPLIFRGVVLDIITLLLFGFTVASYFQTLFLNGRMVNLSDGNDTYFDVNMYFYVNLFIWFVLLVMPLIVWKGLTDSPKYKDIKWEKGILITAVIIIGMQLSGIAAGFVKYDTDDVRAPYYLSYNKALEFSTEDNIIVFLMDGFDASMMDDALEAHPQLYEQLDGFTFYENNTSMYVDTLRSVTQMLTGVHYTKGEHKIDYLNRAWENQVLIDTLRENDYRTILLLDKPRSFRSFSKLFGLADNLEMLLETEDKINYCEVAYCSVRFTFAKVLPYYAKAFVLETLVDPDFSINFFYYESDDILPHSVGSSSDALLYSHLKKSGLRTQSESPTFAFIHLNYISYTGRYSESNEGTGAGSFEILEEYFKQMKEIGIYDTSTIILVADHRYEKISLGTIGLLIKPRHTRGEMARNKTAELSNVNFIPSVLELAGIPHEEYGLSYFDIIEQNIPQVRKRYGYGWDFDNYEIIGDANDLDNWTVID